uniref:Retrotransposon gag domain-containing protein n=1 Tax=Fagus sylvatica TaxID=28930 RepID=A0A2N9F9H3_FAGSY
MAEERGAQPDAPRMTMYQLLHPTQSSIPSCIMFPPNAPHVEIKQGLMAILSNFRGLENENPYVHVRAFEKVISSFYAQNVIETAKLRFFPFSLKDKAKGWLYTLKPRSIGSWGEITQEFHKKFFPPHKRLVSYFYEGLQPRDRQFVQVAYGGGFLQNEPEDAMDYLDKIVENSNTWNGPSPLDSTDQNRSSTTTSGGSVFQTKGRGQHECQDQNFDTSHTTSSSSRLLLEDVLYTFIQKQGEQNQRFDTMFTRIDEEIRETKSQVARLTEALSRTERGKLPSQTQPNPNNQTAKVVNTYKFEEVKSITILSNGKEIGKDAPKANEKSKETPTEKDESGIAKSNDIEKCPFPTLFPQALKLSKNLFVISEILEHWHQVKVNLPLLHLIKQMPLYAKVIKDLCTVKRKHHVKKTAFLTEQVSVIIQHKVPPKYKDPGYPTISYTIGDYNIERALQDLGASVNLLPFSVYLQLGLGRPFLATVNALINCKNGRMEITFGSMTAKLNIFNILEEEQVIEAKNPPRSKKKSLLAYSDAPKLRLKKTPKGLPLASIESHATSAMEVPSKESVDQEVEKAGEKNKFFEKHKTKRKVIQDTRLSKKLLNSSKGVALHVARIKSAKGSNYSFGGSRSGG